MKNYNDIYDDKESMTRFLDTIYSKGYDKGYADCIDDVVEESYQKGLDDAWRCAVKIVNSPLSDAKILEEIFDTSLPEDVLPTTSASEAIAKIKEYEEKKRANEGIKVGDEVVGKSGLTAIVTRVMLNEITLVFDDGSSGSHLKKDFKKTGRHFDIQSLLNRMKEEE